MTPQYVWSAIAIIAFITAALRFLPFLIFGGSRRTPAIIIRLGRLLPFAIMGMLVIYCLKGTSFTSLGTFLPELIAIAIVVLLHLWRRNTLLSIISGTVTYMLLVQLVF